MGAFVWAGLALLGVCVIFFLLGYIGFWSACVRKDHYAAQKRPCGGGAPIPSASEQLLREGQTWFDSAPFEDVRITSFDGLCLRGRVLTVGERARGVVVFFHGYHSSCKRDLASQAKFLYESGYHVLLVDQRSHGESQGKYICFGAKEKKDASAWCLFARERFEGMPIALFGLSMGGATVMGSMEEKLPAEVRCVISDCGFTSPWEVISTMLKRKYRLYPVPVIYFMNYWSKTLASFDYREFSTVTALQKRKLPVLLIHGTEDRIVPMQMSLDNHGVDPQRIELLTVKGARHSQAIYYDPQAYRKRVTDFLERHMSI